MKACHDAAIRRTRIHPAQNVSHENISAPGCNHHHLAKHLPAGKRGHFEARNFGHTEEGARATLVKERLAAAGRVPLIIAER